MRRVKEKNTFKFTIFMQFCFVNKYTDFGNSITTSITITF